MTLASLLSDSLSRLRSEHTGFDLDHVTIQTPPFNRLPQRGEAKLDLYQRMVDRIEQGLSVQAAAVTWYTPMTGSQATLGVPSHRSGPRVPRERDYGLQLRRPGIFSDHGHEDPDGARL